MHRFTTIPGAYSKEEIANGSMRDYPDEQIVQVTQVAILSVRREKHQTSVISSKKN